MAPISDSTIDNVLTQHPLDRGRATCGAVVALVACTFVAFSGALSCGFVDWDDTHLLVANEAYRGLSWSHLRWMFTTGLGGHYQPLSWLSYAIDFRLWGPSAAGFHFTSVLLHLMTAIGFLFVVDRLLHVPRDGTKRAGVRLGAVIAALIFAVHPFRVESVVWVTERRDVLSGAWLMLTMLAYFRAVDCRNSRGRRCWLAASIGCYALSLLSKATGMTLPVVLLILDIYPLRRFGRGSGVSGTSVRGLVLEKLAFAIPAGGVAVVALWAQSQAGALWTMEQHPLSLRIGQAFYGLVFYPLKMICPTGLVPLYEQRPDAAALDAANVVSGVIVVSITILLLFLRRRAPALLTAWVAYVVLVSPMLGLAQSGPQVVADRYSYVSCMPFAVLVGAGAHWIWTKASQRGVFRRITLTIALLAILFAMILATRKQTGMWTDSYTLWRTTVDRAPETPTAHANLATVLYNRSDFEAARQHARRALDTLPGNRTAHTVLARSALALGALDEAESHFSVVVEIGRAMGKPDVSAMLGLADTRARSKRYSSAVETYRAVIALSPGRALAHFRLGVVLARLDSWTEAVGAWNAGLAHAPDNVNLLAQLAWTLSTCPDAAVRDGRRAEELARRAVVASSGKHARAREALAAALAENGDFAIADTTLRELLGDTAVVIADDGRARMEAARRAYQRSEPLRDPRD